MTDRDRLIELILNTPCVSISSRYAAEHIVDNLIANGFTANEWRPASEPPEENGTYLVNLHQEDDETGESVNVTLNAWYTVDKLLFNPKYVGWSLLNEFYELTPQLVEYITHWMPLPQPPNEVE